MRCPIDGVGAVGGPASRRRAVVVRVGGPLVGFEVLHVRQIRGAAFGRPGGGQAPAADLGRADAAHVELVGGGLLQTGHGERIGGGRDHLGGVVGVETEVAVGNLPFRLPGGGHP